MAKILFHICCGPCATASIKKLLNEGYEVVGYYFNPNIHPESEYKKRLSEAEKLAKELSFELIIPDYEPSVYFEYIFGSEDDKEKRCPICWELRLQETAKKAQELGIKEFGTTLRISPYQNQSELKRIAKEIGEKFELNFYEDELVCCFSESVKLSKEKEMYRQKYCGCIFSKDYH